MTPCWLRLWIPSPLSPLKKLSSSTELFLADILVKVVEKSSRVLHDKAIHKAVSAGNPSCKLVKKPHFLQSSRQQQQPPKHPSVPSSNKSSFRSSASASSSSSKASSSSTHCVRERSFESFSSPSQPQVGGLLAWH